MSLEMNACVSGKILCCLVQSRHQIGQSLIEKKKKKNCKVLLCFFIFLVFQDFYVDDGKCVDLNTQVYKKNDLKINIFMIN